MVKRNKGRPGKSPFGFFLAFAVLFFIGGFLTAYLMSKREAVKPAETTAPVTMKKTELNRPPVSLSLQREGGERNNRRLALIIDDIGMSRAPVDKLLGLGIPITFSILPGQTHTKDLAETINAAGYELLVHMPMEPENEERNDPGRDALLVSQTDDEIRNLVRKQIAQVPRAVGVNNHMGSLFTRDEHRMGVVMEELKNSGLFFVDSLTTPKSMGVPLARRTGVKCAGRRVFLDNEGDLERVKKSFRIALALAKDKGEVIAIGHPHPATIEAIAELKSEIATAGVEPVFVSVMVR